MSFFDVPAQEMKVVRNVPKWYQMVYEDVKWKYEPKKYVRIFFWPLWRWWHGLSTAHQMSSRAVHVIVTFYPQYTFQWVQ